MRILSIIETTTETHVKSIASFAIYEEQLSQYIVEKAETLFIKLAVENGAIEEDAEACIEDGYYNNGDYTVSIVWTDV